MALIKSTIVRSVRGFIAYLSASYHPALDQQHRADMLQVPARIASNAAGAFQLQGKRVLSSCREALTQSTLRIGRGAKEHRNAVAKSLPQRRADPQGRLTRKKDLGCFHALTSSTGQKALDGAL